MNEPRPTPKILAVDDKRPNLYALEMLLAKLNVTVLQATSGFEALELSLENDFCLAIVDIQMPEMDGYELVELFRGNPATATLPVIFVSAIFSDEYHHRKGYDAGAVDFLSKPYAPEILLSKCKVFLDLYQQRVELEALISQLNVKNEALTNEIAHRQRIETDLQNSLNENNKLFSIISHDLRTPFQGLLGNAELMLDLLESLSQTDIQAMTESIYGSAQAAYNLLENLLTWARLQQERIPYTPVPIDLGKLTESMLALLRNMALTKQVELKHTIEEELFVYADRNMIATVLRNLVSNALKFTPAEGQVIISAHRDEASSANNKAGLVEVFVSDTGVGMSPDEIDKLFRIDVHHTTPGTAQETGTGLGLILCQEMVVKNGGQIWVESEKDKGTTVAFSVPQVLDAILDADGNNLPVRSDESLMKTA